MPSREFDAPTALRRLEEMAAAGRLSASAVGNLRKWLTEPRYAEYTPQILSHVEEEKWKELDDAFWTVIPFGTGGRRGRMYPIGCNALNDRTIAESAQGLAEYVKQQHAAEDELSCAIAYDTRHNSRHFAELCAEVMVAKGFRVYFLDDYRSTPELSYLVRLKNCSCGIMVTGSHNPPSDNAVKVYWSTGAQVLPPYDKAIIDCVTRVKDIHRVPFDQAARDGRVVLCTDDIDASFFDAVRTQRFEGPREVRIIYSPLHGVGSLAVSAVLKADGFVDVEVFGLHAEPNGDFPNVPGHVSNPEDPAVVETMIEHARITAADLILATDPDCDRIGCAAPLTTDTSGPWKTLSGNQLGALLTDYVLDQRRKVGALDPRHFIVKTLVTTELTRRIADAYGVQTHGKLHVGFKWIAGQVDAAGPEWFVLGTEEAHGFLVGSYVRDKDGVVACMLMAELAAAVKAAGQSLHEKLDALFQEHGYHAEHTISLFMEGSEGMSRMKALMALFRNHPPKVLAGFEVVALRDYQSLTTTLASGRKHKLDAPEGNLIIFDLAVEGHYVAVRPSGTEPKVKFYMFAFVPSGQLADLQVTKHDMAQRLRDLESDLRAFADAV